MLFNQTLYTPLNSCPLCSEKESELLIKAGFPDFYTENQEEKNFFSMYEKDAVDLKRCKSCGFIYTDKLPKDSIFFEKLYGVVKYDYEREFNYHGKKDIYRDIKRQLQKYCTTGTLLDIGTWCGTLLAFMSETYHAVGCEISEEAAGYGKSIGLDIRTGSFELVQFSPESFDVITIIDVLEHLPQPKNVLKKILTLLKPGGLLYIKVPNGQAQINKQNLLQSLKLSNSNVGSNYTHINHFSHKSLKNVLVSMGFQILQLGYTKAEVWDLSFPELLNIKIKKWVDNQIRKLGTMIFSLSSYISPFDLGFNIYVIARKPIDFENV